jgi:hypothetical protein
MKAYYILLFLALNILFRDIQSDKDHIKKVGPINYNLSSPDKIYVLPGALKEVSGITEIDSTSIACVQDENGILFIYDLLNEKIKNQYPFYNNGDYEDIARVDKTVFILRSDGVLFEIKNFESANPTTESYSTGILAGDNEGLCFDRKAFRLLLAPKSTPGKDSQNKENRFIYAFDLKSKKLIEKPVYIFDLKVIEKFAAKNRIKVPTKNGKEGHKKDPDIEFRPSSIGIHPFTNQLFILSGMEKLLFVFDMNGEIEFIEWLNPELFIQPEGITFLKNGDILISNDIKKKKPTILRFNYLRKAGTLKPK